MAVELDSEYLNLGIKGYKRCFVAYLDILGFKNRVLNSENPQLIEHYLKRLIKGLKSICGMRENQSLQSLPVKFSWSSDSILMYTEDNTENVFSYITGITAFFLQGLIDNVPFPIRGALSEGEFYYNSEWNIYFGKAMIDAIQWEKKPNMAGIILTPTCCEFVKSNKYDSSIIEMRIERGPNNPASKVTGPRLIEYDVPIKEEVEKYANHGDPVIYIEERLQKLFCINWTVASEDIKESDIRDSFLSLRGKVKDNSLEIKIQNTYNFYNHCKNFEKETPT